ncbi:MAG: hypothetical protein JWQ71_3259 [Pedosphaera sp.]|nr:hypothetical protein [Pedosphaera sp.]
MVRGPLGRERTGLSKCELLRAGTSRCEFNHESRMRDEGTRMGGMNNEGLKNSRERTQRTQRGWIEQQRREGAKEKWPQVGRRMEARTRRRSRTTGRVRAGTSRCELLKKATLELDGSLAPPSGSSAFRAFGAFPAKAFGLDTGRHQSVVS